MKKIVKLYLLLSIVFLILNIPFLYFLTYDLFISERADFYAPASISFDESQRNLTNAFPTFYNDEIVFDEDKYFLIWPSFSNRCGFRDGNDELSGRYLMILRTDSEKNTLIKKIDISLAIDLKYKLVVVDKDNLLKIRNNDKNQLYINKSRSLYIVYNDFGKKLNNQIVKIDIILEKSGKEYEINKSEKVKFHESTTKYD